MIWCHILNSGVILVWSTETAVDHTTMSCWCAVLTQSRGSFSFSHSSDSEGLGVQKELRASEPGSLTWNGPRGHSITLNNKEKGRSGTGLMASVFPAHHYACWALLSWPCLNTWLLMGSSQWIPWLCFASVCKASALPGELSSFQAGIQALLPPPWSRFTSSLQTVNKWPCRADLIV